MRECTTVSTDTAPLKPNKRVNYTFGMVLGADEFRQEQEHNAWISRNSNLLLHGSGTVCGLRVSTHPLLPGDTEIRISPGYAISPRGKWIWVERELCARLGEWLARSAVSLSPPLTGRQTAYVNICYDECETDLVPIAGQPCADEQDTRAASRILETARAEFSWTPPSPDVERQFRAFGEILRKVEIAEGIISPDQSQLLIDLVRGLSLTTSPPIVLSPPIEKIHLPELTAAETIREALAVWITEVCPTLWPGDQADDCVLLSCVHFELDGDSNLVTSSVEVENCERPVLVPDRLKQELFFINTGKQGPRGPEGPRGRDGVDGAPGTPGTDLDPDLTHICGINWTHDGPTVAKRLALRGVDRPVVAVAFSRPVQSEDLNTVTVKVLTHMQEEQAGDYKVVCLCPIEGEVRPAILEVERSPENTCLILGVRKVFDQGTRGEKVNGVLFFLPFAEFGRRFFVEVKGDFIRDERNVSIDANHLAPWLPQRLTGDRVAGGLFESWFTAVEVPPDRPNINVVDIRGLLDAGLNPDVARRVIEERAVRAFASPAEMRTRLGMTAAAFKEISPLISTG